MTRTFTPTNAATAVVNAADLVQSNNALTSFTFRQRLILAQVLLEKVKGTYIQDALDAIDADAELAEAAGAEQFCLLHSDEPNEALVGIVLSIVLGLR